ncbi:hypothetical protein EBZ39_03715 [bacterium]|nr:hypothetical protein [bacterium]
MANAGTFEGDLQVRGAVACTSLISSSASITDAMIAASGGGSFISPTKIKPRVPLGAADVSGTVATGNARVFVALAAGTLQQVSIVMDTAPTSSDTVVIDVFKSTGGGSYATVLSSTFTMNNTRTNRTVYTATIADASFVAGDIYRVNWTVTGTSGQGLLVVLHGDVNPS